MVLWKISRDIFWIQLVRAKLRQALIKSNLTLLQVLDKYLKSFIQTILWKYISKIMRLNHWYMVKVFFIPQAYRFFKEQFEEILPKKMQNWAELYEKLLNCESEHRFEVLRC